MTRKRLIPSEKKRLSYERDGRNTRAESKSSRKAIPNFKARSNRASRHGVIQALKAIEIESEEVKERVETKIANKTFAGLHPVKVKIPDEPLGAILATKKKLSVKKAMTKHAKARMTRLRFNKLNNMGTD